MQKVIDSKFIDPQMGTADISREYNNINDDMKRVFQSCNMASKLIT